MDIQTFRPLSTKRRCQSPLQTPPKTSSQHISSNPSKTKAAAQQVAQEPIKRSEMLHPQGNWRIQWLELQWLHRRKPSQQDMESYQILVQKKKINIPTLSSSNVKHSPDLEKANLMASLIEDQCTTLKPTTYNIPRQMKFKRIEHVYICQCLRKWKRLHRIVGRFPDQIFGPIQMALHFSGVV